MEDEPKPEPDEKKVIPEWTQEELDSLREALAMYKRMVSHLDRYRR
jgi:hypothetical protein